MKTSNRGRPSNIFYLISIILIIMTFTILWLFTEKNEKLFIMTIFALILILINLLNILMNKKYSEKINESNSLINLRMNKALNHSIFYIALGIPFFISSVKDGLIKNWLEGFISIIFILIGVYLYIIDYKRREIILEKRLMINNKSNLK